MTQLITVRKKELSLFKKQKKNQQHEAFDKNWATRNIFLLVFYSVENEFSSSSSSKINNFLTRPKSEREPSPSLSSQVSGRRSRPERSHFVPYFKKKKVLQGPFFFISYGIGVVVVCVQKKKVPHSLLSFVFSCWWAESVESSAGVFGGRGAVVACQCVSRPLDSKLFSRAHSHTRLSADSLPVPNCVSVCVCVRVVPCNNVFLRF